MATRKPGGLDPQIVREIERQTQKQEIEERRKKRKWFFWLFVCSGAVLIPAGITAFIFLLLEW